MKTKSKPSECLELATNAPHTRMRANKAKVRPLVSKSKTGKNQRAVSCTKIHVLSKVPRPFDDLITSSNRFFFLPIFSLWLRAFPFSAVYFDSECYKIVLFGPLIKPLLLWIRTEGSILTPARKLHEEINSRGWRQWSAILPLCHHNYRNDSQYVKHQAVCALFVLKFNVHPCDKWHLISHSFIVCLPKTKKK